MVESFVCVPGKIPDPVDGIGKFFFSGAKGDPDVVISLRTKDAAWCQENMCVIKQCVRKCEPVLVALWHTGPYKHA